MTRTILVNTPAFGLVSYGNGERYALHNNEKKTSLFVQGADAVKFRTEMEFWAKHNPEMSCEEVCRHLWVEFT